MVSNPYKSRSSGRDPWAVLFWLILTGWVVVMTGRGVHRRRERRAFLRHQGQQQPQRAKSAKSAAAAIDPSKAVRESDSLADVISDQFGAVFEQAGSWMEEQAKEFNFSETFDAWGIGDVLDHIGDMADQAEDEWGELTNGIWEDGDDDEYDDDDEDDEDDPPSKDEQDTNLAADETPSKETTEPETATNTPPETETPQIIAVDPNLLKPAGNTSAKIIPVDSNLLKQERKVFIDLGANCGNSYLRFKQQDGDVLDSPGWEVYLWEANPQIVKMYLHELMQQEQAEGKHQLYLLDKAAVVTDQTNATVDLYLTKGQDDLSIQNKSVFGGYNPACDPKSGLQPSGATSIYGSAARAGQKVSVPAVDFPTWFEGLRLAPSDTVMFKVDIEGAEVPILLNMTDPASSSSSDICVVNKLWIEYHASIFPANTTERQEHEAFQENFPKRLHEKCQGKVSIQGWH